MVAADASCVPPAPLRATPHPVLNERKTHHMRTTTKRSPLRTIATATAVLATAGVLAACGDDDEGSASSGTTATQAASAVQGNEVDKAFVRQMIPHHQGAIEMAKMAEEKAEHQEIKATLSPAIVKAQEAEIATLTKIAGQLGVTPDEMSMESHSGGHSMGSSNMEADAKTLGISMENMGMDMSMSDLEDADPFDQAFIDAMVPHHQGAIRMARAELAKGTNPELKAIAEDIVAAQEKEIKEMNSWREEWYGEPSPAGGVPS